MGHACLCNAHMAKKGRENLPHVCCLHQKPLVLILVWLGSGLAAFIAQAKYDSFILEVITTVSAVTLAVRVILGYNRMAQRCANSLFPVFLTVPVRDVSACNRLVMHRDVMHAGYALEHGL